VRTSHDCREEARFRWIFREAHAGHHGCSEDEWLFLPCRAANNEPIARPLVWSRRNGPWRRVEVLWVGAAPGNAGGKGSGSLGAHGTRIPFGGDIAGANLEALFGSIGLERNRTFITAALNQLPQAGGGEPTATELAQPVGNFPSSLHLLRETILAAGPRLLVLLGTVAVRSTLAAAGSIDSPTRRGAVALPGIARVQAAGLQRGVPTPWPAKQTPDPAFRRSWQDNWSDAPLPVLLWLTHPSGQNMSPFAATHTLFHQRMREARAALIHAAGQVLGIEPPNQRPHPPGEGIYALPEWRERIAPAWHRMDELWRAKGV
jgi:uracil-DNA glycosylase